MLGDDKIKDLFASRLGESFEPEVPAGIWAGIDSLLSQFPIPTADPGSSSAASSGSAGTSAGSTGGSIAAKIGIGLVISAAIGSAVVYVNVKNDVHTSQTITDVPADRHAEQILSDTTLVLDSTLFETPSNRFEPVAVVDTIENIDQPIVLDTLQNVIMPQANLSQADSLLALEEDISLPPQKQKGMYVAVVSSFDIIGINVTQNKASGLLISQPYRSDLFMAVLDKGGATYLLSHQQPITVGLSVGKHLHPKLAMETGIFYTHASSILTSTSSFEICETQQFDYIGIPVYLKYNLLNVGKLAIDAKLGGMIQKDVQGKLTSAIGNLDYSIGGTDVALNEPYYISDYISQAAPQFSLHGSFAFSYPIYKQLSVLGTIGGIYYFDAGNKYRTIYSDQKFQLNTAVGLKINF